VGLSPQIPKLLSHKNVRLSGVLSFAVVCVVKEGFVLYPPPSRVSAVEIVTALLPQAAVDAGLLGSEPPVVEVGIHFDLLLAQFHCIEESVPVVFVEESSNPISLSDF
jgi:hypothetical protein